MNAAPQPLVSLAQLPLFPLQTVLFPGGRLPLQIFEVRYLDMIKRQHETGQPFGVVCLTQGSEVQRPAGPSAASASFDPVGTLAVIETLDRPQQGLMVIECAGTQRFRVRAGAHQRFGLWCADVDLLDADVARPVPEDLVHTRDSLQSVMRQIRQAATEEGHIPEYMLPEPHQWDDCGWLANRWSELLPMDLSTKHRLMALDSPVIRLELVADVLERLGTPTIE